MSIGRTGKRAQRLGQHRQQRHQVSYDAADGSPLYAPQQVQRQPYSPVQQSPISSTSDGDAMSIQRDDDAPVESAAGDDAETPTSNAEVTPEAVAERVYAMLKADAQRHRERTGKPHKR